jgi:hypothetical protein
MAATCAALVAMPAASRAAIVAPAGLLPGEWYNIAFVTSGTTKATSGNIATYDDFVRTQAALNPELVPFAEYFEAVAATPALIHDIWTDFNLTDYPVFNTRGEQLNVTPNIRSYGQFFFEESTVWSNPLSYDQFGEASHPTGTRVWTGVAWKVHVLDDFRALGSPFGPGYGVLGSLTGSQFAAGFESSSKLHPLYAYGSFRVPFDAGGGATAVGGASMNFPGQLLSTGSFSSTFYEPGTPAEIAKTLAALNAGQSTFILPGVPAQIWDLDFSGAFTGSATVTLHYNPASVTVGPSLLRIRHWTGEAWETPANQIVDPVAHTITFNTDSFSPFLLTVVPEPSGLALGLLGSGLLVAAAWRRRK